MIRRKQITRLSALLIRTSTIFPHGHQRQCFERHETDLRLSVRDIAHSVYCSIVSRRFKTLREVKKLDD